MSKKKSQISKDELYETTSGEQITGEPVDSTVNPDGITIGHSIDDSEKITVETDEKPVTPDSEKPVVETPTPDTTVETPVTDEKPVTPVNEVTDNTVVTEDKKVSDKEPVKLNEFKRFNIRLGYSIDSRSTTTRRTLSTTEIVKQFVKAPTCFIAFESKEDVKEFETILKVKNIKVENNEGKLVEFSDVAKKHLVERVTELSKYWISRNSK